MKTAEHGDSAVNKVRSQNSLYGFAEIAESLGVTKRAVEMRAAEEHWTFQEVQVRGGRRKLFPLKRLPDAVKKRILVHFGHLPPELDGCVPLDFDKSKIAACAREFDTAAEWQRTLARQRLEVLERLDAFRSEYVGPRTEAVRRFADIYNAREVD